MLPCVTFGVMSCLLDHLRSKLLQGMGTATVDFEFLKDLPTKEEDWPDELLSDLKEFKDATVSENGLIPNATCPEIFQVSKQRWQVMSETYQFKCWNLFGKKWFSRTQLEQFHKLDRTAGQGGRPTKAKPSLTKMVSAAMQDAASD